LFQFCHDFEVFSRETFEFAHAEPMLKKVSWELIKNQKVLQMFLKPFASFQIDFLKSLLFGYFLLVLKNLKMFSFYRMLSMRRHFVTACSACVGILLPHAQHA
jgi:hypothetical protein